MTAFDIVIVGAGHNGLVTAAYLARAGKRVLVLERRDVVGGACVTEELWPGFKVSTAAYVNSLLRPEIIRDLELPRHGFELLPRSPSSFTPFPDGRFLLMGPDKELTRQQVAKFSERDAAALPRYEAMLERVADFIEPTLLQTPPNPWSFRPKNLAQLAGLGWRFLKLGRDGIPQALASAARAHGAEIRVNSRGAKIVPRRGRVKGVALEDGTEFQARKVVSNADAHVTFLQLLEQQDLGPEFLAAVKSIDYTSASLKINVALSELPDFTAVRGSGLPPNGHLRGTIHVAPTLDYIERAYDDAKYGRPSADPILECTIPSVVDTTVAPPGKHVMSFFVQYAPYQLRDTTWDEVKDRFADRCFDILNEYAPNFKRAVIDRQVLSPLHLERRLWLTGGNIFQGAMTLSQLFFLRPLPGYADYRTPIKGLYLCGSATHPGGGGMGACGYNAAREILRDGKR